MATRKSLSQQRSEKAQHWVEEEVVHLLRTLNREGRSKGSETIIPFGELFEIYENESNSLVGMLQRARRRGFVAYEGTGLLLQGKDNDKMVRLLPKGVEHLKTWKPPKEAPRCEGEGRIIDNVPVIMREPLRRKSSHGNTSFSAFEVEQFRGNQGASADRKSTPNLMAFLQASQPSPPASSSKPNRSIRESKSARKPNEVHKDLSKVTQSEDWKRKSQRRMTANLQREEERRQREETNQAEDRKLQRELKRRAEEERAQREREKERETSQLRRHQEQERMNRIREGSEREEERRDTEQRPARERGMKRQETAPRISKNPDNGRARSESSHRGDWSSRPQSGRKHNSGSDRRQADSRNARSQSPSPKRQPSRRQGSGGVEQRSEQSPGSRPGRSSEPFRSERRQQPKRTEQRRSRSSWRLSSSPSKPRQTSAKYDVSRLERERRDMERRERELRQLYGDRRMSSKRDLKIIGIEANNQQIAALRDQYEIQPRSEGSCCIIS